MKKIPTLFQRTEDRRYVIDEVTPGCEWVLAGEGVATRKWDGTCVLVDAVGVFVRREVKDGKDAPPNFMPIEHDDVTGKTFGWEPYEQSGFAKFIAEALASYGVPAPGTYELVGPKINGNPEHWDRHVLLRHGELVIVDIGPRTFDNLARYLRSWPYMEGVVWHHPDGRMAKLKRRDFPRVPQEEPK